MYVYVYMYVCMCIYIYIYIYIFVQGLSRCRYLSAVPAFRDPDCVLGPHGSSRILTESKQVVELCPIAAVQALCVYMYVYICICIPIYAAIHICENFANLLAHFEADLAFGFMGLYRQLKALNLGICREPSGFESRARDEAT